MKVVGIVGSPRKNSNTETIVKLALSTLAEEGLETELITLANKRIEHCDACYLCVRGKPEQQGRCDKFEDDFPAVFDKMKAADGIIIGAPNYISGVASKVKAVLDRISIVGHKDKPLARKVGGPIVLSRRAGQNTSLGQMLLWFMLNDMIVPGSFNYTVVIAGKGGARDALQDEEGTRIVERFARNMAWLMKKINSQ